MLLWLFHQAADVNIENLGNFMQLNKMKMLAICSELLAAKIRSTGIAHFDGKL